MISLDVFNYSEMVYRPENEGELSYYKRKCRKNRANRKSRQSVHRCLGDFSSQWWARSRSKRGYALTRVSLIQLHLALFAWLWFSVSTLHLFFLLWQWSELLDPLCAQGLKPHARPRHPKPKRVFTESVFQKLASSRK